jgi:hypothetical protein
MTHTTISALYCLGRAGYQAYYPIDLGQNYFIVESPEGDLSKVFIRRASGSASTPILTLSRLQQSKSLMSVADFLLVVHPDAIQGWLIPVADVPLDKKTFRLGQPFDQYIIRHVEKKVEITAAIIKQQVERLEAYQDSEDLEGILDVLETD